MTVFTFVLRNPILVRQHFYIKAIPVILLILMYQTEMLLASNLEQKVRQYYYECAITSFPILNISIRLHKHM